LEQGEKAPPGQLSVRYSCAIATTPPLEAEGPHSHPDPLVQTSKQARNLCVSEVSGPSSQNRVKLLEDCFDIYPLLAPGQRSNAVSECIYGFLANSKAVSSQMKAEELKAGAEIRETSFRLMERQLESLKHLLDVFQGIRGFFGGAGEDQKIVGISDKSPISALNGLIQVIENDIRD
jgi:hypothetical protein